MGVDDVLKDIRQNVEAEVGTDVGITDIEFEAAVVVIYTTHPDKFAEDTNLVRRLAKRLRKRVVVRADSTVLASQKEAEKVIKEVVPAEAEVTDIFFEEDTGEVLLEAKKPGLVIGRHGATLNELKRRIGWSARVARTPPIPSKTVEDIRSYLRQYSEERKTFLRKVGRRIYRGTQPGKEQWVRSTALGGYREVGRSCHLLQTSESKVLIDCGVNPGGENGSYTPYLALPEVQPLNSLDAVILTHAHLDHCGLIPLLYKLGYDGPLYMTPPTRELSTLLQMDMLKVAQAEGQRVPYDADDIRKAVLHTIPIKYGDTTDIAPDVKVTFQNAGHILGSASVHFHIGDGAYNVLFTGDIKYERSWLYNAAVNKFPRVETVVMEATYGGHEDFQPTRQEAGDQLREVAIRTINRGGRLLVPVFAVGRSQEVMLVLEELIQLQAIPKVPIYLDGMIWEATAIHTAHPEYLNTKLRNQIFHEGENPLLSEHFIRVDSQAKRKEILASTEPCIILATSGMVNGGPIMEYLREWSPDPKSTLVFVGFQASGTLGHKLQRGRREIPVSEGGRAQTVKVELDMVTIDGFSGHSDRRQLVSYIANMIPKPHRILLNHGEESRCLDLASALHKKYRIETRAPHNLESVRLY